MSATRIVPAGVPSDVQSSRPEAESVAANTMQVPDATTDAGSEPATPGFASRSTVPAGVPSVRHSSRPWIESAALK